MNKFLGILIASLFAASSAFAASHTGAPMAGASSAKPHAKAEKKTTKKAAKARSTSKQRTATTKS